MLKNSYFIDVHVYYLARPAPEHLRLLHELADDFLLAVDVVVVELGVDIAGDGEEGEDGVARVASITEPPAVRVIYLPFITVV